MLREGKEKKSRHDIDDGKHNDIMVANNHSS